MAAKSPPGRRRCGRHHDHLGQHAPGIVDAFAAVWPNVSFVPTGGIDAEPVDRTSQRREELRRLGDRLVLDAGHDQATAATTGERSTGQGEVVRLGTSAGEDHFGQQRAKPKCGKLYDRNVGVTIRHTRPSSD